jgi:hypothetical protein
MKTTWSFGSLVCVALLAGCASAPSHQSAASQASPPPQPASNPAAFLPGRWEAQISGNHFQMVVNWNPSTGQYEGVLSAQGAGSQHAGFKVGELVWTATPTANPNLLNERQEARDAGLFGPTGGVRWLTGTVDLRRSTKDEFVTSFARFKRVGN